MTIDTPKFADAISEIANILGVAAEKVFEMFVRAQPIIGILHLASIVVAISVVYLVLRMMWKPLKECLSDEEGNFGSSDDRLGAYTIVCIVAIVVFLIVYAAISDIVVPSVLRIMCPEYMATKEIIGLVIS